MKRENFATEAEEEVASEKVRDRGAWGDPAHSLAPAKTVLCAGGVERWLLGGAQWEVCRVVETSAIWTRGVWWKLSGRDGPHAELIRGTRGCPARHGRRKSREAAVQVDGGLRVTVAGLEGRPDNNCGERREELCCP